MEFTKFKKSDPSPSITYDVRRELWLLVYAINSCKLVCHLCELLLSGEHNEGGSTYTGIVNAIYVAYSRPFHWCRSVGRLSIEDLKPDLLETHTEMIHLRDKLYAHKDLNGYQVEKEIFNTVRAVVIDGKMSLLSNELIPRGPKISQIQKHAENLISHFNEKCKELYQKIRKPGWPPDGEYILNMDPFSDDIFISVQDSESTELIRKITEQNAKH